MGLYPATHTRQSDGLLLPAFSLKWQGRWPRILRSAVPWPHTRHLPSAGTGRGPAAFVLSAAPGGARDRPRRICRQHIITRGLNTPRAGTLAAEPSGREAAQGMDLAELVITKALGGGAGSGRASAMDGTRGRRTCPCAGSWRLKESAPPCRIRPRRRRGCAFLRRPRTS